LSGRCHWGHAGERPRRTGTRRHDPEGTTHTVRTVIVDDVHCIRLALRRALQRDGRIEVVGDASNIAGALEVVADHQPDLVVLDLMVGGLPSLTAIADMRRAAPRARVAVVGAFPDPWTLRDVLDHGGHAYLDKDAPAGVLAAGLAAVGGDGAPRPPAGEV
jgi:DNA-binding NarL/FixJ family response regulator